MPAMRQLLKNAWPAAFESSADQSLQQSPGHVQQRLTFSNSHRAPRIVKTVDVEVRRHDGKEIDEIELMEQNVAGGGWSASSIETGHLDGRPRAD